MSELESHLMFNLFPGGVPKPELSALAEWAIVEVNSGREGSERNGETAGEVADNLRLHSWITAREKV